VQTKCTDAMIAAICETVGNGNFISVAARFHGVSERQLHKWRKKGRDELERLQTEEDPVIVPHLVKYIKFHMELEKALTGSEVTVVAALQANPDWRAQAHYLSRRFGERWGPKKPPEPTELPDIVELLAKAAKTVYEDEDAAP